MADLKQIIKLLGGTFVRKDMELKIVLGKEEFIYVESDCRFEVTRFICEKLTASTGYEIVPPNAKIWGFSIKDLYAAGWPKRGELPTEDATSVSYADWEDGADAAVVDVSVLSGRKLKAAELALEGEGFRKSGMTYTKIRGIPDLSSVITAETIESALNSETDFVGAGVDVSTAVQNSFKQGLLGGKSPEEKEEIHFAGCKNLFSRADLKHIPGFVKEGIWTWEEVISQMTAGLIERFGDRIPKDKIEPLAAGLCLRIAGQFRPTADGAVEYRKVWKVQN